MQQPLRFFNHTQGAKMRNLNANKVFFSAFQASQSEGANETAHRAVLTDLALAGVPYRVLAGVYKGAKEKSILLQSDYAPVHTKNLDLAAKLAKRYSQECILEVQNDGTAFIHRVDQEFNYSDKIGTFHEASEKEALDRDAYTHDAENGRYYVVD
jgi:hypothetical protein